MRPIAKENTVWQALSTTVMAMDSQRWLTVREILSPHTVMDADY